MKKLIILLTLGFSLSPVYAGKGWYFNFNNDLGNDVKISTVRSHCWYTDGSYNTQLTLHDQKVIPAEKSAYFYTQEQNSGSCFWRSAYISINIEFPDGQHKIEQPVLVGVNVENGSSKRYKLEDEKDIKEVVAYFSDYNNQDKYNGIVNLQQVVGMEYNSFMKNNKLTKEDLPVAPNGDELFISFNTSDICTKSPASYLSCIRNN